MQIKKMITASLSALLLAHLLSVSSFAEETGVSRPDLPANTEIIEPEERGSGETEENAADDTDIQPDDNPEDKDTSNDEDNGDKAEGETQGQKPDTSIVLDGKRIEDPVFVILNNRETLYLSIGEKELREYVEFFRTEMDMNNAAIAGVLANLQFESGFDPNRIGDYGAAYGLCQWRGARLDAMVKFCDENGLNPVTMEGQLRFIKEEFENSHKYAGELVRDTKDTLKGALLATQNFCYYYEVPADPDQILPDREKLVKELLYPLLCEWENN